MTTAYNWYILKKAKADHAARRIERIPRTDRLDGGAKLDERRRLAEQHRAQSSFNVVSQPVLCPQCGHQELTRVRRQRGRFTWLLCLLGCFWAPFCNCTKDTVHSCPHCHTALCVVKKLD